MHLKVFEGVHRVLKKNGTFALWDVRIPQRFGSYKAFMVRLRVRLPDGETDAGYGVKWQPQDIEYFKELAYKTRFRVRNEFSRDEIFYLEMVKIQ